MTMASTSIQRPTAQRRVRSSRINHLALVVGLALVSWGRRSSNRPTPTSDEIQLHRQVQREGDLARADYAASRTFYGAIR